MKLLRYLVLMAGLVAAILFISCSGSTSSSSGGSSTVQVVDCSTVTPSAPVQAIDYAFNPTSVSVPVNGVVKWTDTGAMSHTVTSGTGGTRDGVFDQGMNPGTSVCLKFTAAGTYNYFCSYHYAQYGMAGTVTVQ